MRVSTGTSRRQIRTMRHRIGVTKRGTNSMRGQGDSSDAPIGCVATVAREQLVSSGYAPLKSVECSLENGVLVLRGTVPSYYLKQIAQERIRSVPGVTRIVNELDVQ